MNQSIKSNKQTQIQNQSAVHNHLKLTATYRQQLLATAGTCLLTITNYKLMNGDGWTWPKL